MFQHPLSMFPENVDSSTAPQTSNLLEIYNQTYLRGCEKYLAAHNRLHYNVFWQVVVPMTSHKFLPGPYGNTLYGELQQDLYKVLAFDMALEYWHVLNL